MLQVALRQERTSISPPQAGFAQTFHNWASARAASVSARFSVLAWAMPKMPLRWTMGVRYCNRFLATRSASWSSDTAVSNTRLRSSAESDR